jgi:hypothetical protein
MNRRGLFQSVARQIPHLSHSYHLYGALLFFPDLFEPANEARLGRFHKSSHGSLLYVLIPSSIALEREVGM